MCYKTGCQRIAGTVKWLEILLSETLETDNKFYRWWKELIQCCDAIKIMIIK